MVTINEVAKQYPGHKSNFVAYLLWLFLGVLGAHRFYVGKWVSALIMMGLSLSSTVMIMAFDLDWFTYSFIGIWLFVDLFLIPSWVERCNQALLESLSVAY